MRWWVRVTLERGDYGRWIPTGLTDFNEAKDYIETVRLPKGIIVEWLQL